MYATYFIEYCNVGRDICVEHHTQDVQNRTEQSKEAYKYGFYSNNLLTD